MDRKSDFFFLIDIPNKKVVNSIQTLPLNWRNIHGLPGLSDDQLENLRWAGHPRTGWLRVTDPRLSRYAFEEGGVDLQQRSVNKILIASVKKKLKHNFFFEQKHYNITPEFKFSLTSLIVKPYDGNKFILLSNDILSLSYEEAATLYYEVDMFYNETCKWAEDVKSQIKNFREPKDFAMFSL